MIDVEPTAEAITVAAQRLIQASDELKAIALKMRESNDLSYSTEALMAIMNALQNTRIDLFITRPIRAFQISMKDNNK